MTLVRRRPVLVLALLVVLFVVVGLVEAWRDSPTVDESIDIAAGVTSLVRHDLRLMPEHGVLTKLVPALPALAGHPIVPDGVGYRSGDWFVHTDEFVRANAAAGKLQRIVFLARLVPLVEGVAVGCLLYVLGTRLFGPWPGLFAAAMWFTTPVFVGFSHLVSIDVAFTLATVGVSLTLLWYLERPSDRRALAVGAAVSAALLTRHLGLVVGAATILVIGLMAARQLRRLALRHAGVVALSSWAAVWIVVRLFAFSAPGGAPGGRLDSIISSARGDSFLARAVLAIPWPKEWAAGYGYLTLTSTARPAYLFGHAWRGSQWWYFGGATLVKVPLVALVALMIGPFAWRRVPGVDVRRGVAVIAVPAVALYAAAAVQPLNLGLRYVFPSLALWFVAAGPVVLIGAPLLRRAGLGAVAVTQVAAFVAAAPHSLAWTAPPFQPGYRVASDSNIDWGQDDGRVADWSRDHEPLVDLLLPLGVDPPRGSRPLLGAPANDVRGWVAVSATRLTVIDRDALSWLRAYCAVDTIGGSVVLYRFDAPVDMAPGPSMPVGICSGGTSSRGG